MGAAATGRRRRDATASDAGDSGEMGEGDDKWDLAVSERARG